MKQGVLLVFLAGTAFAGDTPAERPVARRAQDVQPVQVGQRAPVGVLLTPQREAVDLAARYAQAPTMLIFYRGGWCPYCNVHLGKIQRAEHEVRDLGFQVLAISPDSPENLADSLSKQALTYTLLSDSAMEVTRAFGLAFEVDDATRRRYRDFGIDLEAASGRSHHLLPVPAVYLVDRGGIVRFAHWNPDYTTRLGPEELVTAARRLATAP